MELSENLLAKLVCPKCKGKLNYVRTEGRLECGTCRLAFRIDNGVPVLLIDEAEKLK
ncbi:MAG: Trm112 family protein [Candidatus Zixiibacteriota bacterium]|nr:MAG: Trm112 family protein [candidate division Zixibacteria bacterium]